MPKVWDSSTVMTPSLPTLSMASAIISPISASAAEMEATWAIWALDSVSRAIALSESTAALHAGLDTALERHRVGPGGDVAQPLVDHGPGQDGGRGGAVTGDVVGLLGYFFDQLGADLLPRVLEVDLLGDRDPVVGDGGGSPLLLENDVAALRAEGDADGVGQLVHTVLEGPAGFLVEGDQLGHGVVSSVVTWSGHRRGGVRGPSAGGDRPAGPGALIGSVSTLACSSANSKPRRADGGANHPGDRRRVPGGSASGDGGDDGEGLAVGHRGVETLEEADVLVGQEDVHEAAQRPGLVEKAVGEAGMGGVEVLQDLGHRRTRQR